MPIISNASLKQQTSGGNTGRCREMCVCEGGGKQRRTEQMGCGGEIEESLCIFKIIFILFKLLATFHHYNWKNSLTNIL